MPRPGRGYDNKAINRNDRTQMRKVKHNAAETRLITALNQGFTFTPADETFLRAVFNDPMIMKVGATEHHRTTKTHLTISKPRFFSFFRSPTWKFTEVSDPEVMANSKSNVDRIYRLYNAVNNNVPNMDDNLAISIIKDIGLTLKYSPAIRSGALQNVGMEYGTFAKHIKERNFSAVTQRHFFDFYYFNVTPINPEATYRVYLNVKPEHVAKMVSTLNGYLTLCGSKVEAFKVAGPGAMPLRADNIVIYVADKTEALFLANYLYKRGSMFGTDRFNAETPRLTQRVAKGIAIGAEPKEHVATGFGGVRVRSTGQVVEKTQKSFGSLRAQAIAAAVANYHGNKDVLGESFETFKKFVGVSFRAFGVDPENPADNL